MILWNLKGSVDIIEYQNVHQDLISMHPHTIPKNIDKLIEENV